jgi:hypothetical protein
MTLKLLPLRLRRQKTYVYCIKKHGRFRVTLLLTSSLWQQKKISKMKIYGTKSIRSVSLSVAYLLLICRMTQTLCAIVIFRNSWCRLMDFHRFECFILACLTHTQSSRIWDSDSGVRVMSWHCSWREDCHYNACHASHGTRHCVAEK